MSTIIRALYAHELVDHEEQHAGYAPDWDAYQARLATVKELAPGGLSARFDSPLALLDEQVMALVNAAWLAGAEYGERLMKGDFVPSPGD